MICVNTTNYRRVNTNARKYRFRNAMLIRGRLRNREIFTERLSCMRVNKVNYTRLLF